MTETTAPINLARWPQWLAEVERKMFNRLITASFNAGFLIEVIEGEEGEQLVSPTKSRKLIQEATAASDVTLYVLHRGGQRCATFTLTHGEGEDALNDYSWACGEGLEEIVEEIAVKAQGLP